MSYSTRTRQFNPNHQVTRRNYAECVQEQVVFLHQQEGTESGGFEQADLFGAVDVYYDNAVSVDAAAADLFARGW